MGRVLLSCLHHARSGGCAHAGAGSLRPNPDALPPSLPHKMILNGCVERREPAERQSREFREHLTAIIKRKDLGLTRDEVALIKAVHDAAVPAAFWRYEDAEEKLKDADRKMRAGLVEGCARCNRQVAGTGTALRDLLSQLVGVILPTGPPVGAVLAGLDTRCRPSPGFALRPLHPATSTLKPRISASFKRGYPFSESFRQRSFDGRGDPVWVVFAGNVGNDAVLTDDDIDGEGIRAFVVLGQRRRTSSSTDLRGRSDTSRAGWTRSSAPRPSRRHWRRSQSLRPCRRTSSRSRLSMSGNSRLQTGQNVAK